MFRLPIINSVGESAWPAVFPLEKIDALRDSVGARHFSSQMMLDYIASERARLDPGALIFYDGEFDARTAKLDGVGIITGYACYWDPSSGRYGNDNSVCVMLYTDNKNRRAFIHDVRYLSVDENDAHPLATQCENVLDFMRVHGARVIGIEVNGMGNALPEIMRDTATKLGQGVVINRVVNHTRKEARILDAIEPLLTTGRLWVHERVRGTPLLSEMLGWSPMSVGGHDDGLDAVAGALRCAPTALRATGQFFRPVQAKTEFNV